MIGSPFLFYARHIRRRYPTGARSIPSRPDSDVAAACIIGRMMPGKAAQRQAPGLSTKA